MTSVELPAEHMQAYMEVVNIRILQISNSVIKKNGLHHFSSEVNFKLS